MESVGGRSQALCISATSYSPTKTFDQKTYVKLGSSETLRTLHLKRLHNKKGSLEITVNSRCENMLPRDT